MNSIEIVVIPKKETDQTSYSVQFSTNFEVEWGVNLVPGATPAYQVTFRAGGVKDNNVYTFINSLIFDKVINLISDIKEINITQDNNVYTIKGEKIRRIDTTSSVLSAEVIFSLRDIVSTDPLPYFNLNLGE